MAASENSAEIYLPTAQLDFFPALKLFFDQFFLRIYCREFKAKGLKFKVAQDFLLEVNLDSC